MNEIDIEDFVKREVETYREKDSCFGFEDVKVDDNTVELEGYTYFTYGPDQEYSIASFEYFEEMPEAERNKIIEKARELYKQWGNEGDFKSEDEKYEFIAYATDCLDYTKRAEEMVKRLNKTKCVSAEYDDDGETIFIEAKIKQKFNKDFESMTMEEFEEEERIKLAIEEVMDCLISYKYG